MIINVQIAEIFADKALEQPTQRESMRYKTIIIKTSFIQIQYVDMYAFKWIGDK